MTKTRDLANLIADSKVGPSEIDTAGTYNMNALQVGGTTVIDSSRNATLAKTNTTKIGDGDAGVLFNSHGGGNLDAILPFDFGNDSLYNGHVDIGGASNKFKDLHMSGVADVGSVEVGGTTVINSSRNATFTTVGTPAGTAAAPAYTFSTDTNTGMFKRGTDQIGFSAGGTEMLALTSTGIFADKLGNKSTGSDLTLDAAGSIILDAASSDLNFKNSGVETLRYSNSASGPQFFSPVTNKDIIFKGKDDTATVTALTLDMSEAGRAIFNAGLLSNNTNDIRKAQITSQYDSSSFLRLHPSATTNSGGYTNMFFGTSTDNNYGVAIGGVREGTDGTPSFAIRMHNDSIVGTKVLTILNSGNVGIKEGNPSHELTVAGNSIITKDFGTALDRTYTGAPSYSANGGDLLTLVNSADAASGSQYASIWVQTPQYTGSSGSTRTIRFGGQSVPRAYSADFFVQTRGSNAQLRTRMTVGEEGVMRDYTGNTSANYKWFTPVADDYQVREYDFGNRVYIKKDAGGSGNYSKAVFLNRYLPADFDMTFELEGGTPSSTYRHFAILLNGDGGTSNSNWDHVVLRQHSSNSSSNTLRWDNGGTSRNAVDGSSNPNFFDGTKRRVRIEKRYGSLRVEISSFASSPYTWGTHTGLTFTNQQGGYTGFVIYEPGATDTWIEITNLTITEV